jgi:hypothetical protein
MSVRHDDATGLATLPLEAGLAPAQPAEAGADRVTTFTLRVAAIWQDIDDLPRQEDGHCLFRPHAALTGSPALTSHGQDVGFSDLEV